MCSKCNKRWNTKLNKWLKLCKTKATKEYIFMIKHWWWWWSTIWLEEELTGLYSPFFTESWQSEDQLQTIATEVKNIFWGLAKCLMYNPGQVQGNLTKDSGFTLDVFVCYISGVPKVRRRVLGMLGFRCPLQVPHVRYCWTSHTTKQ